RAWRARSDHGCGAAGLAHRRGRRVHGGRRDPSDARHREGAQSAVRPRLHAGRVRRDARPHRRRPHPDVAADHRARRHRCRGEGVPGAGVSGASRQDAGRMIALATMDSVSVAVLTDDVSDNYVTKTAFAVSEFSNIVRSGARVISGEALLCANLGYGLRLVSNVGDTRHTMLFDTGPESAIFIRNCTALGIALGDVEAIAVTHGHWDHMAALPATIDRIVKDGGRVTVHVNPGMFNERAVRLGSGNIVPVANVPPPRDLERHGAVVVNSPDERLLLDRQFYYSGEIPRVSSF